MFKRSQDIRKLPVKLVTGGIGALHSTDDIYSSISIVGKANALYRITVGKLMAAQRARNSFTTPNQKEYRTYPAQHSDGLILIKVFDQPQRVYRQE